ncbi:MAG: hypothetical protein IV086_06255 [Hyphomonadaceae bacterium]|nr:MAG: hypothetical protein FD160_2860 [Caulobacteraceae bacterium]MBT9445283.1 hypothetical protein [Hyphomonadaceae bacterium]TPW07776.1 MAG: hypothetical protein FD124_887 [Alphaproteobacteria bacterium]
MFHRIIAAAIAVGAMGGATLAFGRNQHLTSHELAQTPHPADSGAFVRCQPVTFRIYFEPGSSHLNREAGDVIDSASRHVAACDGVQFQLAADPHQIASPADRRRASARSVVILSALRSKGVFGEVYVAPLGKATTGIDETAGPDFVEVGITPTRAPLLISSKARQTEI